MLTLAQCVDYIYNKALGADRSERTAVDTFTAADTFLLIDDGDPVLIVCNRVDRTAELTRSLQMCDCIVRTGLRTSSTFFTFCRIDVGAGSSRLNRTEFAGIDTSLSKTVLAVLRYNITGNRTVLTCRTDDLNHIAIISQTWRFALRQTDSLSDNLSFFINTAAKLRCRTWDQAHCDIVSLLVKLTGKCQLCHFIEYVVFDFDHIFISIHRVLPRPFLFVNFLTILDIIYYLYGIARETHVFLCVHDVYCQIVKNPTAVLCNIFPGSPLYCYFGTCSIRNDRICSSSQITGTG